MIDERRLAELTPTVSEQHSGGYEALRQNELAELIHLARIGLKHAELVAAARGVREWMEGFQFHKKFPAFCEALAKLAAAQGEGGGE